MDVIFLGYNDVGLDIYEWLRQRDGVAVQALITGNDQLDIVHQLEPDLLVSVGYDHLVPEEILEVPDAGAINLHPSYLPYNRGKSPNVWSIVDGTPAGVTLHYMDADFDTGPILEQRRVDTSFEDTGKDLHERLERAQFDLFTDVWPDIEGGTVSVNEQRATVGSYHSVDDFKQLCEIDPEATCRVHDLLDRVRALTFPPFDNAYLDVEGQRYYVELSVKRESKTTDKSPSGRLSSYD